MKRGTPDHPKTLMLTEELRKVFAAHRKLSSFGGRAYAVGLLEMLWEWTSKYAIQGDIGKWPDDVIAAGIGWPFSGKELISCLISAQWVDRVAEPHRLVIHDLQDHASNCWRQNLENAGITWWDGSAPRRWNSKKSPKKVQKKSNDPPQPEPEPEPEPEPIITPQPPKGDMRALPDDLGNLIQATAAAMRARHAKPAGLGGPNLERKLTEIATTAADPQATIAAINRRHQEAVTREWRGWEPRYVPRLLQWLEEERYLDPIATESPPDRIELARRALE